jgi:hypothetical protein
VAVAVVALGDVDVDDVELRSFALERAPVVGAQKGAGRNGRRETLRR